MNAASTRRAARPASAVRIPEATRWSARAASQTWLASPTTVANGSAPRTPSAAASTYSRPQRACSGVLTAAQRSITA